MAKGYFIAATLMILQGLVFCAQPTHFSNFCSFNNGTYNISWMYNATTDKLYFMVEVAAAGWVGFGLAADAPTNMTDYDVAVGGIYNGTGCLKDYLTIGQEQPRLDTQQDWNLTYSSEVDNVTTLKFHRMRNTSDSNDTAVQQGVSIYVIWAYHSTYDVNATGSFMRHTNRGFENKTLIPATDSPTPSASMSPSPSSSVAVKPFPNNCSFNNGNYNMSWMYNATANRLYFVVRVRTTGWVGFGLASQAPTNMTDYDVAVGGVYNGTGYLKDYLTVGQIQPRLDTQQNWKLTNSSEVGNVTTLLFYRQRNTSDTNDTAIQIGKSIYIVWAYHSTNDVNETGSFDRHTARGFESKTLIPVTESTTAPETTTETATTTETPTPTTSTKTAGPEVVLSLTVNIDCSGSKEDTLKAKLQEDILEVFRKAGFPTKSVTTRSSTCNSPLKITLVISFYTGIPTNISVEQVFEDALKAGQIRELTVANTEFSLTFPGVTISYKPKSGECDRVCCNGAGGALTVEGSCSPADKCAEIKPADKQETGHCPGESKDTCKCGSEGFHNSNFALIILLGIATFMKNSF